MGRTRARCNKRNKKAMAKKKMHSARRQQSIISPGQIYDECINDNGDRFVYDSAKTSQNIIESAHYSDYEYSDAHSDKENNSFENTQKLIKENPLWCHKTYPAKLSNKSSKSGTISSDEYDCIMDQPFNLEGRTCPVAGNRIVELGYLLETTISLQYNHSLQCTGKLYIVGEIRRKLGLASKIGFKCTKCNKELHVETENPQKKVSDINYGAVWGTLATGSTYGHLEEFLGCLNVPSLPKKTFYAIETRIGQELTTSLTKSMKEAGEIERQHAIDNDQFCPDRTPWIRVFVDGSWSKRSYGTNYDSLSGTVAIIGAHTGQLLFVGVKNRYCAICARANNKNEEAIYHECFKNWSASAPAIESALVVEGFSSSESMHGLRYMEFVGDGDSSVYSKIKQHVPYGQHVRKIECTNHALKNYGKNLRKIKADKHINIHGRKLLTINKINLLTKRAKCSIYEHSKQISRNLSQFREDLKNNLHHVFGDHSSCRVEICKNIHDNTKNQVPDLQQFGIYEHLYGAQTLLLRKAHLLIENENNNKSEGFMNVIARFNMGKRLNLIQRGSYERRVHMAGLRFNASFNWHTLVWINCVGSNPGQFFRQYMEKETKYHTKRKQQVYVSKRKRQHTNNNEIEYGENVDQPEDKEALEVIMIEAKIFTLCLQVTKDEILSIERQTVGQFNNEKYEEIRKHRLTASLFGNVIKKRPYTSCHQIVKKCLKSSPFYSPATEYGITKESVVKRKFEQMTNLTIKESGLWIDEDYGFLGASPDGLIGDNEIIEIKCIYAPNENFETLEDLIKIRKNRIFLRLNGKEIQLKRNHNYYYQIQGQLNIAKKNSCYFVVYVNDNIPLFVEKISVDEKLWKDEMLPPLKQFYTECIAPEVIRGNLDKNLKCIDPPYIQKFIDMQNKKQKDN